MNEKRHKLTNVEVREYNGRYCIKATYSQAKLFKWNWVISEVKFVRVRKINEKKGPFFWDIGDSWINYETGDYASEALATLLNREVRKYRAQYLINGAFDD
jgi:hypothetical protein